MNAEIRTANFYNECCEFFGDLGWAASCFIDADAQFLSYKTLSKYLFLDNVSLLDVGCGQGDFLNFIFKSKLNDKITRYKGIDVSNKMIQHAQKKFSEKFFSQENFLSEKQYDFDISIAVGTFNIRCFDEDQDQINYLKNSIKKMYESSKKSCALTILSYHGYEEVKKDNRLFWYEPWEILQYCFSLTDSVIIDHASIPAEFILILHH